MSTTANNDDHDHAIPLWGLFLTLLAFTAAEVGLYEIWRLTAMDGDPFMPKVAMVLVILFVLTLPKGLIVLTYFMHLKFERQFIIGLAIVPFVLVAIAILPTLVDTRVNTERTSDFVRPQNILGYDAVLRKEYEASHEGHGEVEGEGDDNTEGDAPATETPADDTGGSDEAY